METTRQDSGLYVVIEGPDGGGSSTQIDENLKPHLANLGLKLPTRTIYGTARSQSTDVVFTREPGGTKAGEVLRYDLLHDLKVDNTPQEEFAKFNLQRQLLGQSVLKSALADQKLVISERNWYSSYAYQASGWELDKEMIVELSRQTMGQRLFEPDAVVVLMVPPEVTHQRLLRRKGITRDKIERRDLNYFRRVYDGYEEVVELFGGAIVDATKDVESVGKAVINAILEQISQKRLDELVEHRLSLAARHRVNT